MGKYSDLFEDNTGPKAAINLIQGVDEKPDAVADEVKLARRYNLPVDMVKFYKPEYDSRAKADDALDSINNNPVLKSWLAADGVRAKLTHDDLPTLGGMEHAVNYVFGSGDNGSLAVDAMRSLASGVPALGASMYGVAASGAGLVGATGVENWLLDAQKKSDAFADSVAGVDGNASYIRRMVRNAFQSVGETLVAAPFGMERGLLNLSKTAAEAFVPGVFGVSEYGSAYGKGREQGLSPQASSTYAAENAAYEYLFERYFGETGFLKKLAAGESPANLFKYELTRELPGELATTLGQNFNEWLNVNPDKPFSQFLAEQPQDLIDTAVSTLIGGGAQIGIGHAVQHAVYSDAIHQQRAQAGERNAQIMSRMSALAAASKTLDRDPTTFESYAKDLTDGTPAESFFVDANVLHQSGVGDMLAQAMPEVAEQYSQALQTGGLVQVPTAEFLSKFGKSDVPDQLVDHVKFDPQDMSRAESMEFFQSGQAEQLKNDLEQLVAKQTEDDAFQKSADTVRENIRSQLESSGRFRADTVNAYADLWKAYFSVTAAKLGTTPEALFNKRAATVASTMGDGQAFDQALKAYPPKGWVHVEDAGAAKDIWNGSSDARAVFWTELKNLPEFDGYSHSFSKDAAAHILNRHGDEKTESNRGQIAIQESDVSRIPQIIESPDSTMTSMTSSTGSQLVAYAKRFDDGVIVYLENVSKKRKNLSAVTMWKYPPSVDEQQILKSATSGHTSETNGGMNESLLNQETEFNQKIDVDGTLRPVLNSEGRPIAQTEEDIKNFWRWFGNSKVVDADAYTARFPQLIYAKVPVKKADAFNSKFRDVFNKSGDRLRLSDVWDLMVNHPDKASAIERFTRSLGGRIAYLESQGEQVHIPVREKPIAHEFARSKALQQVYANLQPEFKSLMALGQGTDELMASPVYRQFSQAVEQAVRQEYSKLGRSQETIDKIVKRRLETMLNEDGVLRIGEFDSVTRSLREAAKNETVVDDSALRADIDDRLSPADPAYQAWVKKQFEGVFDDPKVMVGKRKVPLTLDNVVAAMTSRKVNGAEQTMTFSGGQARASMAKRFKSLQEIQADRDRVVSPEANDEAKSNADATVSFYRDTLLQHFTIKNWRGEIDTWEGLDNSMKALAEIGKLKNPSDSKISAALRKNGFDGFDQDAIDLARKAAGVMRDAPVDYFEAKPQRAVRLNEFAGAVIPIDTPKAVRDVLEKAQIKVKEYKESDEDSRREAVASLSKQLDDETGGKVLFQDKSASNRGYFNPSTNVIGLLQNADLSTFLHESGHYFLEMQFQLASELAMAQSNGESLTQGEQEFLADNQKLLDWMGVSSMSEWHNLDFEEKRSYHEQFARGFEAYLFEGKAPSVQLHGIFQKFRSFLLNIYKSIKNLNVQLTDEVRSVFDRMLATNEEIQTAERARSMMPLFDSAQSAGMNESEFAEYQNLDVQRSLDAIDELQAKAMRDMQWARRARSRVIRQLQNQSKELRREATMDASREVMAQPVYQAWQFLKRKLSDDDKLASPDGNKSDPKVLDETKDSLFTAIAKLGGLDKSEVIGTWGTDPADKPNSGVFGSPVWRVKDGRTIDDMAQALGEAGYLSLDENGKVDLREFEERFDTELRGNPQFSAFYIPDGEFMAGSQVQNSQSIEAGRIDLAALHELDLPKEVEDRIKSLRMTAKTGWHPDFLAERFGFTSGDEMVRALAAATPPREAIANRAQEIMQAEHGELATPEAIEREADKAVSNESRARMIAMEMDALQQALGGREDTGRTDKKGRAIKRSILPAQAKAVASQMIGRLKIRNIKPGQYTAADTRAGKAAEKALKEGNQLQAYTEKRNQMISTYAARQAFEALDEVDAGLRYLRGLAKMNSKTIDMGYMEQIENLLSKFDLQNKSLVQIDKRTSLATWMQSQVNQGIVPEIDPAVFLSPDALAEYYRDMNALDEDGKPVNGPETLPALLGKAIEASQVRSYKDVTMDEFRGLVDTVKQIEHLGRLKKKLLTAKDQREYEAVRDEIAASIREHAGDRSVNNRTEVNNLGEKKQTLLGFLASHIKASTIARVLDGGKDGGAMWEYFVRPANERGSMETTMRGEATQALAKIMEPVIKAGKMGGKGKFIASVGRSFNREQQFVVALNMGNEGNMQRLMDGESWTADQVHDIVAGLTLDDWKAVQQVWDHLESYWPLIEAKEKRVYGKAPNKIEVRPLTVVTASGEPLTLKGGYYPVKYDPRASQRAEAFADADNAKALMKGAFTSATTRRSFTKDRAERVVGRPLMLSLSGLYSGVNEIIHDLSWHEWLIDTNRLLRSETINNAIRDAYGADTVKQLRGWINDIAAGDKGAAHAGDVAASYLRRSVSMAGLGFNIMSALMQPIGITQSMVRVGYGWIGHGIQQFVASPLDTTRMVQEKSEFMRNRFSTQIRELAELKNQVQGQNKVNQFIGDYGYLLMTRAQQVVDVPTWLGAYNKALSEGNDDERASALADQAVIDSQGNGETKDLAAIERGGPLHKMLTVFYSFMNTALNVAAGKAMTEKSKGKLAVDMLMVYSVPVVLGMLLKSALTPSGGGGDDDESLAKKLAVAHLDFFMSQFVYVREFSAAAHIMFGDGGGVQGYSGPSGFRMVADATQFAAQANQGEFDDQFRKSAINLLGDFAGLPSAQINRTITGFNALRDGETHNPLALVAGYKK